MEDLNDLYFYVQVVDHGGFAAAGRALGMPKSKLSRRISGLEERLGVRLLNRSTRRFSVTDIGRTYYAHCKAMLVEAILRTWQLHRSAPDESFVAFARRHEIATLQALVAEAGEPA